MHRLINVISTKRSGHHAFIEWYRAHNPQATHFINNPVLSKAFSSNLANYATSNSDDPLIINYEGAMPSSVYSFIQNQERLSFDIQSFVFLRDPLNLAASLIHRKKSKLANLIMILRQLLAERSWILERKTSTDQFFHLSYNDWLLNEAYRASLATRLGLLSHELIDAITPQGGGSSFDSKTELSASDRLKLVTRWHGYRHDALFEAILSHPVFSDVFSDSYAGLYPDSLGKTFADEQAALYFRQITSERKPRRLLDRLIERLAVRLDLFEKMDRAESNAKKPLILRAFLTALSPKPAKVVDVR